MPARQPTFEEALRRLEHIAVEIEQGKIGLEESIKRYEEGMKLVATCRGILQRAEQRIKELQPAANGELTAEEVDPPEEGTQTSE